MSSTLHHLFASKESATARHDKRNIPSMLWMGPKDSGIVFSGEKPTGGLSWGGEGRWSGKRTERKHRGYLGTRGRCSERGLNSNWGDV